MAIRFYVGGTPGATDGTLISSGDMTAPVIFDGMYPAAGVIATKAKNIFVRADPGEVWMGVHMALVAPSGRIYISNYIYNASVPTISWDNNAGPNGLRMYLPKLGSVNIGFILTASINGSDLVATDLTCYLTARGVKV